MVYQGSQRMRLLALTCLLMLVGCAGFTDHTRVDHFSPGAHGNFTYSTETNTVMTANDDGAAERIRREWLAEMLTTHRMCGKGYAIDSRRLVIRDAGTFGNGGDVRYTGHCV